MTKHSDPIFDLLDCWDDLSAAIDRTVTALPGQMTAASESLEAERLRFRDKIQAYAFNSAANDPAEQKP